MVEIVIERWTARDGQVAYHWTLWVDGRRLQMGGPSSRPEPAEAEALAACQDRLGRGPDRTTRL